MAKARAPKVKDLRKPLKELRKYIQTEIGIAEYKNETYSAQVSEDTMKRLDKILREGLK